MRHYPPVEERFWSKVEKTSTCWLWKGCAPTIVVKGKRIYAHKLSYSMHFGPIPEGQRVRRVCRDRRCVRPDHLELFNMRGSNHPRAKLSEDKVLSLLLQAKEGVPRTELARRYGVSPAAISQVVNRRSWKEASAGIPVGREVRNKKPPRKNKVTKAGVREIRRRSKEGALVTSLAEEFGLDPSFVSKIVNRRRYKDVE